MNWEPAEQTATNPDTGEKIAFVKGQWMPITQSATNPDTGEKVVILAGAAAPPSATAAQRVQASLPGRILQGARDPVDGAAQLVPRALSLITSAGGASPALANPVSRFFDREAQRVDAINAGNEQAYEDARQATGQSGFDGARLLGNMVSPVNVAASLAAPIRAGLSVPQLVGRGAVGGAVGGLLQPVNDPQAQQNFGGEKTAQATVGAITGGLLTPAMARGGEALVRRFLPSRAPESAINADVESAVTRALDEIRMDPRQVPENVLDGLREQAAEALRKGRSLDVAAALRKADFDALGMPSLLGQVTRDPMQYARELNLRGVEGVGEPLTQMLLTQRRTLGDRLRNFSGGATERADAGEQLATALARVDEGLQGNVRKLYDAARSSTKADLDIPLAGFAQDVADVVDRFGDKVPSGVMNQVRALGLLGGTQRKIFNLLDADRLSKVFNDNVGNDPAANAALSALRQSLRNAVESAVPAADNPFLPAVQAARDRFALHDALPALHAASQGGVNEDRFVRQYLVQARPTEVRKLADVLRRADPEAMQQARQQIGAFLERAAFGMNQAGDKAFAPERFAAALDSLGTARLKAFFTPDEIAQMRTMARVGAYIGSEPAGAAVNRSNTAAQAGNLVMRALRSLPGGPAALAVGESVARPVVNSSRVSRALAATVPQKPTAFSPEQLRALSRFLPPLVIGAGVAGAAPSRE